MAQLLFEELAADTINRRYSVAGKEVLQIVPDPSLRAAKWLIDHGAAKVIAAQFHSYISKDAAGDGIDVIVADPRRFDETIGGETVDIILGVNLLHQIPEIRHIVDSISQALRPGGMCLLHGHPIWTSARGHRISFSHMGKAYQFYDVTNPIPLWGHLYMNESEMRRELAVQGHSDDVIERVIQWVFKTNVLNRTSRKAIFRSILPSRLEIDNFWEEGLERPDQAALTRIRHGDFWDPNENYDIRSMTFMLRKREKRVPVKCKDVATSRNEASEWLERLYALAKLCFSVTLSFLPSLPRTRASQARLVDFLEPQITDCGIDLRFPKEFLAQTIGFQDANFIESWGGTARDVAWLMLHETLSNFFVEFAMWHWQPDLYIIHHVPKCAGTSVNRAMHEQSRFIAYPQTGFEMMVDGNGLLGFATQVFRFGQLRDRSKLYVGGHFNLPRMISRLGIYGRCKGVTLIRSPDALISSALRFVWTRLEQEDRHVTGLYPALNPATLRKTREDLSRSRGIPERSTVIAVETIMRTIIDSPQFQSEYNEIFVQYFCDDKICNVHDVEKYLSGCGEIIPCINPNEDSSLLSDYLDTPNLAIPRDNVSTFTHSDLARCMGGEAALREVLASRIETSSRIYEVLLRHRHTVMLQHEKER